MQHQKQKLSLYFVFWLLLSVLSTGVYAYTVENGRIKNGAGEFIELRGVSWYGGEVGDRIVPSGLHIRNYVSIIGELKNLGFNAVRLPFCPRVISDPAFSSDYFWVNKSLNPTLYNQDGSGKTPLEVFKAVAEEFSNQGFYILVDHHRIDCQQISPLWYTANYSEQDWLDDLSTMTTELSHLSGFIGVDLKNEPHNATWGEGDVSTDWKLAAERAATQLMPLAPNILMFVEGVADERHCGGNDFPFWFSDWGGNLSRQLCSPVNIPASKLVLSPHVYGPAEGVGGSNAPRFFSTDARQFGNNAGTPDDLKTVLPEVWDQHFGRLAEPANGNHAIAIGEYGIRYGRYLTETDDPLIGIEPGDSEAVKQQKRDDFEPHRIRDVPWADAFVGYLTEKGITDTFWWAINGDGLTGGIYYGFGLPRPDGTINSADEWVRTRSDIVSSDPLNPGLLNRFWNKAACFDGFDNDQDGLADSQDPDCANAFPSQTTTVIDDQDLAITYSGSSWSSFSMNRLDQFNESEHEVNAPGHSAELTFEGTGVELVSRTRPWGSTDAEVYIDNALVQTLSFQGPDENQKVVFSSQNLVEGTHTIRIENKSFDYAFVDAFIVTSGEGGAEPPPPASSTTIVDDQDALLSYSGGWTSFSSNRLNQLNQTEHEVATPNQQVEFTFDGTGVALLSRTRPWGATDAAVYIDNTFSETISFQGPDENQKTIFSVQGLAAGSHTIRIESLSHNYTFIDAFEVTNSPPSPPVVIDDQDAAISYIGSGWASFPTNRTNQLNQSDHEVNQPGNSMEFTFDGSGISLIARTRPWGASDTEIYIDNILSETVSFVGPDENQITIFSTDGLSSGNHTLRLEHKSFDYSFVDALEVRP